MDLDFVFGSVTLKAGCDNWDSCGSNGLPVTPNSIAIVGNYKSFVGSVKHPNLVQYLDCYRSKHEKVCLTFEHCIQPFNEDHDALVNDLVQATYYLHNTLDCVHGCINPESVVFDGYRYKLTHWALNHTTENGRLLDSTCLLPKNLKFLAPERVLSLNENPSKASDVWSLALTLVSIVFKAVKIPNNPADLAVCSKASEVLEKIGLRNIPDKHRKWVMGALQPLSNQRMSAKDILLTIGLCCPSYSPSLLTEMIRFEKLDLNDGTVERLAVKEAYQLWCLLSCNHRERANREKRDHQINSLPSLVMLDSCSNSSTRNNQTSTRISFVPTVSILSTDTLRSRLSSLDVNVFYPLILSEGTSLKNNCNGGGAPTLPLIIRESDFEYQCERVILFKYLLRGVPFVRQKLVESAKLDITPHYRAQIWACILNVKWSDIIMYDKVDKLTITSTDRQIGVDIPRCHQYNDLLASPEGHRKLTRVLKAWLSVNEPNYVYWQGLDSLAAPFVVLNFENEALAFACFNAFIHKYLRGFFNKDNSTTIQEYLALFSHLIAFHNPQLFNHLRMLGFTPELYAIPWFLTMFTHVLPIHKIVHVWDTLLLGSESFPLFMGLSILMQLSDQLLGYSFNDCILIFSDLPEINIETSVKEAIRLFCVTPKSATLRGKVPLPALKEESCPRIEASELITLLDTLSPHKLLLIDGRAPDLKNGQELRNAASVDNLKERTGHSLVVVVDDLQLAAKLVAEDIPFVCSVVVDSLPKELLAVA